MIKVVFHYQNYFIKYFSIYGHAEISKNDEISLVCAGVSSVVFGVINSLDEKNNHILIEKNRIIIKILNLYDTDNQIVLNVLLNSILMIEENNKNKIKIKIKRS